MHLPMPSRGNHQILLPLHHIRHRRSLSTRRHFVLPQFLPTLRIKRPHHRLDRRRRKHQSSRGHHRPAQINRPCLHSRNQRSQRHVPQNLSAEQIHRHGGSPRRRIARRLARRKQKCPVHSVLRRRLVSELAKNPVVLCPFGL